jgi:hypothetical protein
MHERMIFVKTRKVRHGWSVAAIAGFSLSLTSMASVFNLIISACMNIYAYVTCRRNRQQGRKLAFIGIIITIISLSLSVTTGTLTKFMLGMSVMSFLISVVLYVDIVLVMNYIASKRKTGEIKGSANWVRRYGKLLFVVTPKNFGKTQMVIVDSRNGTPFFCERSKETFGDRYFYTAEQLSWKEVRRLAQESENEDIQIKFSDVDADNWFRFTKN